MKPTVFCEEFFKLTTNIFNLSEIYDRLRRRLLETYVHTPRKHYSIEVYDLMGTMDVARIIAPWFSDSVCQL